jgi:uncharacterized protein YjbI with pentapeptide repeats
LYFLLIPLVSFAQNKVDASRIIDQINRGEAVSYQNVEITGDLNFTHLQNMKVERNSEENSDKTAVSIVKTPLRFTNCRFTGDVLAYVGSDNNHSWKHREDTIFNAHFEEDVIFENCIFENASAFKYSKFSKNVSFQKSLFKEEALFKYSKFAKGPNFSNVSFEENANFKYTDFPKGVNFAGASFKDANFKYAKFTEGVSMKSASFNRYADFKYTQFSQPLDLSGVAFSGNEDFKYAKVDGKAFTSYLLNNR